MIPELTMYRASAAVMAVMAVMTVAYLLWVARLRAGTRRYLLVVPFICATLASAYLAMSLEILQLTSEEGVAMPLSRFADYMVAWPIMVVIAGLVAGARKRQIVAVSLIVVGTVSSTILAWYLPEPAAFAAFGGAVAGYLLTAYGLLGPMAARARLQSGERRVLYAKLRNLLLLLWGCYLVLGIVTRQGLGVLDAFTGVFVASYLDVIIRIGFGAILLRSTAATDHVIAALRSSSGADGAEPGAEAVAD